MGVVGIVLAVVGIALGLRKPNISTLTRTLISILDLLVLVVSVILFGKLGLVVFVVSTVLALLVSSLRLAVRHESIITSAAIEGGFSKAEMTELYKGLRKSHVAFAWLGPMRLAELIRLLAQRARSPAEIEQMALPLAMLLAAFDPLPMAEVVEKFDRLLRLAEEPASRSMALADTLTVATQKGAATLMEMLDGMIDVYSP